MRLPPKPPALLKSLRGLGYSPKTAIADLVDNSLTARATHISIEFVWDDVAPQIRILDNGKGMSQAELEGAMRFGSDPAVARDHEDLGRFGLGLKTASLSQARSLTVCAKQQATDVSIARWDIDHIEASGDWDLLKEPSANAKTVVAELAALKCGTLIIWEKMDRLVEEAGGTIDGFLRIADEVAQHLGMVFHRFLSSERLSIKMNNDPIAPWDPFMIDHPDCRQSPSEELSGPSGRHSVVFTGYVLPPQSRLTSEEMIRGAGTLGWIAHQGFYIYRHDRLIVNGGWLGLGRGGRQWTADRAHHLARISLDITNASDLKWALDVLKSRAVVPVEFQDRVRLLAQKIRQFARNAFRAFREVSNRGRRAADSGSPSIWIKRDTGATTKMHINRRHPLVVAARQQMRRPGPLRSLLEHLDRYTPTFPIAAYGPIADEEEQRRIKQLVRTIYYSHKNGSGLTMEEAQQKLLEHPVFRAHEAFVVLVIREYEQELAR